MSDFDRYAIKVRLKNILHQGLDYSSFFNSIDRANKIINLGYLFIRAFVLYTIEKTDKELVIDVNFIRSAIKTLNMRNNKGRPSGNIINDDLIRFYDIFIKDVPNSLIIIDNSNLSYIFGQAYKSIYNEITNNIFLHFEKHVWKFIKSVFNEKYLFLKENKKWTEMKELTKELKLLMGDFLNDTKESVKYRHILELYKDKIIPKSFKSNKIQTDSNRNTFAYIKCMHFMNSYIGKMEQKCYQIMPIRTSCYSRNITINTSALIDIFFSENKLENFQNSGDPKLQEKLWNKYFNLKKMNKNKDEYKIKKKGFSFNYEISTDGFQCSLNYINNSQIANKQKKKANFKKARNETNLIKKNAESVEDYDKYLAKKLEKKLDFDEKNEIAKKKYKKDFAKKSQEEKSEIIDKIKDKSKIKYLSKVIKDPVVLEKLKVAYNKGKLFFCDPGMRSIIYGMASNSVINEPQIFDDMNPKCVKSNNFGIHSWNNRKIMNYTNNTRMKFAKIKEYSELINNWKTKIDKDNLKKYNDMVIYFEKIGVDKDLIDNLKEVTINNGETLVDIEVELSKLNSKSCSYNDFMKYVSVKLKYNKIAEEYYDLEYLKKLNWFSFIERNKHEDLLLDMIEYEFGSDIIIIMGDWSCNKKGVKFISTPNKRLLNKLNNRFDVLMIDEYKTSKIHYKHNVECEKIIVPDDNGKTKQLHSVLLYKNNKVGSELNVRESGCINRDKNAVLNMERIVKEYLEKGKLLPIFKRNNHGYPNNENLSGGTTRDAKGAIERL